MCTSWSSANQISNFKFSVYFRVLFALSSLKYPHPKSQQTPRVSTELEMVVNLSYSVIPFQKWSQKGVDRSVENRQKRAENIEMAPNTPNKLSWRMRNKMPLCLYSQQNSWVLIASRIKEIGTFLSFAIKLATKIPVSDSLEVQIFNLCKTFWRESTTSL